jgi:hypothetical protein
MFSSSTDVSSLKIDENADFSCLLTPIIHLKLKKWRFATKFL